MLLRLFLALTLAILAQAERRLPADLQVDLLFPRPGHTYAPTQWFPIVLGMQNLDALWPFDLSVSLDVRSLDSWENSSTGARAGWQFAHLQLNGNLFADEVGTDPKKHFLYYPIINMTNGTTDRYVVRWGITVPNRCFANMSYDYWTEGWSSGNDGWSTDYIIFNTAPGGETPDVAATIDGCPEGGENTTTALRVTEVRETDVRKPYAHNDEHPFEQCPVFETDVRPSRCAYRDVAQELAANVSAKILQRMRCNEGTWHNIKAPCNDEPKKNDVTSSTGLQSGLVYWALVLGLSLAAYYHVF